MMRLLIINGVNLNLLGTREPDIYGSFSFESYLNQLEKQYPNVEINYWQSNVEGEIVSQIQGADKNHDGIIINPGAYTHTSIAIADAIKSVNIPVVEVHVSNIYGREDFRKKSFISPVCKGCIVGFGLEGYRLAIESFLIE